MQHCIFYKLFAVIWAFSLLMIISLTAISAGYNNQYSLQLTGGQSNPWALPQATESYPGFQQPQKEYQNQQYQQYQGQGRSHQNRAYQADRFVTPELLESLKQQQTQMQLMPDDRRILQFSPEQLKLKQPESSLPGSGSFAYPSYGMDYMNPLYNIPSVTPWSPWGIGRNVR